MSCGSYCTYFSLGKGILSSHVFLLLLVLPQALSLTFCTLSEVVAGAAEADVYHVVFRCLRPEVQSGTTHFYFGNLKGAMRHSGGMGGIG